MEIDLQKFKELHKQALELASLATIKKLDEIGGDCMACGFAWVSVFDVRKNSKFGKLLSELGYQKDYRNVFVLWNPSGNHCQNVDAKEVGAGVYANTIKAEFTNLSIYANSRLD